MHQRWVSDAIHTHRRRTSTHRHTIISMQPQDMAVLAVEREIHAFCGPNSVRISFVGLVAKSDGFISENTGKERRVNTKTEKQGPNYRTKELFSV